MKPAAIPASERRLAFVAEWFHAEAGIIRTFLITYYVSDKAVEVFDQRNKRTFLRRTKIPELTQRDFFVGSKINVFGRQFDIVDYADDTTRTNLAKYRKKGFVLLKNNMWTKHLGKFLKTLIDNKININQGMMVQFSPKMVTQFLSGKDTTDVSSSVLMNELLAGPAISLELIGDNVVETIKACAQYKSTEAETPSVKLSPSLEELFEKHTLAIIKPHSIKDGLLGDIISEILSNGFRLTAMRMILMARINCEEFYEVYRGVLPEYIPMVAQLASGVCMCMEIACVDPEKITDREFRNFCGPMDPEIAKLLRPHTLRAKFGKSKVQNAVHCTDLPDDSNLELQYMFKIID
ncbi:GM23827 [Drosophila sechellia]|uniref:GM23827 n=1 Tax=Drosophila sechellia TaxID=7238 RepID=B4HJV7_DROSE|nr:GM23827 [Drosophila sechellia]